VASTRELCSTLEGCVVHWRAVQLSGGLCSILVSPVVVLAIFVFPSHKNGVYI
jgi:hypothetical protein